MIKLLIDAGTSWSKVLEFDEDDNYSDSCLNKYMDYRINSERGRLFLFPSTLLRGLNMAFDSATGHMAKNYLKHGGNYENEIIALAYGAKKILNNPENATIVDLGSRDSKWIKFKNGKYKDLDWNGNCGSSTGATVEMLCKFYNVNPSLIEPQEKRIPVTCGVFAMEKIMDAIVSDTPAEIAIAQYIHGIAYNTWCFAGKPEKIFLSGGFCLNRCFINSLEFYCSVEPLGRFVLIEGLF